MTGIKVAASLFAFALAVGACSGSEEPTTSSPPTPPETSASPEPDQKEPEPSLEDLEVTLEPVAEGLDAPLLVTSAGDSSGRIFVVEQGGTIRIVQDGDLIPTPFLDISDRLVAGGEQGLLGLAFHPDYEDNGRFFVNYTDLNGDTIVARYSVTRDPNVADPGSEGVLLQVAQPFANHNGGHLVFGEDGYLYVGLGDGGSGGDPMGNGQSLGTLLGKLLRIDVDSGIPYGIPDDNPFAGRDDARPEIWAYGLRNPWRFSFDATTQDLWVADVGQNEFEEVNHTKAKAGLNFGWNAMEGRNCFAEPECDEGGKVLPVTGYSHDAGCSITGGHVYRGSESPSLEGVYVFGDYCSGTLWGIDASATSFVEPSELAQTELSVSSFGTDEDGELYVADIAGGAVFRVVAE